MELLLAAGADPKQTGDGKATPLHAVAAVDGKDEQVAIRIAQALLAAGADANAQDEAGFTALVVAAARRQMALVRLLLPVSSAAASGLEGAEWTEEGVAAAAIARLEKLRGKSGAKGAADHAAETTVTVPEPAEPDEALAADCKRKGDEAFVKREYAAAEQHYSASLRHATRNHVVSLPHCTTPARSVGQSSALCRYHVLSSSPLKVLIALMLVLMLVLVCAGVGEPLNGVPQAGRACQGAARRPRVAMP